MYLCEAMHSNESQFYVLHYKIIVVVVLLGHGSDQNMLGHGGMSPEQCRLPSRAAFPFSGPRAAPGAESELLHQHVVLGDQDLDGEHPQGSVPGVDIR